MVESLPPPKAQERVEESKGVVVDLRDPHYFARIHPRDALSLPFSARGLAERLAAVLPEGTPVMLLGATPSQADAAAAQLEGGPYPVLGAVRAGISGWTDAYQPVERFGELQTERLAPDARPRDTTVLDVREPMEWEMGYVPDAILISLSELRVRLDELLRDRPVAVICEAGIRSSTAASILQAAGFAGVLNVPGGTAGYRETGLPLAYYERAEEDSRT